MTLVNGRHDIGRVYAECILFWMLENVDEGDPVEDFEMQEGSGLPDFEFQLGMTWLMQHNLLDHRSNDHLIH